MLLYKKQRQLIQSLKLTAQKQFGGSCLCGGALTLRRLSPEIVFVNLMWDFV